MNLRAASPTPWYSRIVSNMSSMSALDRRRTDLTGLDCPGARPPGRMAHACDLGMAMPRYSRRVDGASRVPVLSAVRRSAGDPTAEAGRSASGWSARPAVSCCTWIPKIAVGTIIQAGGDRLVLVHGDEPGYGLWVLPGGYVDRGRSSPPPHSVKRRRSRPRRPARRTDQHLLVSGGRRSSSCTPRRCSGASCAATTNASRHNCSRQGDPVERARVPRHDGSTTRLPRAVAGTIGTPDAAVPRV